MTDEGRIVNLNTGDDFTEADLCAMRDTVKAGITNTARGPKHIKKSDIWNTQQTIRKIQRQLVEGYTFDTQDLTALVNTMFGFINGIVDPNMDKVSHSEIVTEEITE